MYFILVSYLRSENGVISLWHLLVNYHVCTEIQIFYIHADILQIIEYSSAVF